MALERQAPRPAEREDMFYCAGRTRRLPLGKCLEDYTNANAMTMRRRVCYRCPQGRQNRAAYAASLPLE